MPRPLPRRARLALIGAGCGVVLLAITWYISHYIAFFRRIDVNILLGFAQLDRPGLNRWTNHIATLCDPKTYVVLALIPVVVALARRRPSVAAMIAFILLGANETTQLLKPLLVAPRDPVYWSPIGSASWPSGHATASMSLALCMVIAAPARRRPAVAAAMVAFALAVCYSFLELGWHYPSDVFGGFLVAATWTMLGIAGLSIYEARARRTTPVSEVPTRTARAPAMTVGEALTPMAAMTGAALLCLAVVALARPHAVLDYARGHEAFVIGACAIGLLGLMLASGLTLMLRR